MALGDTNTIDILSVHNVTGDLVLTLVHEQPWEDAENLLLLQSKLNSYLAYVLDGQLAEDYPEHKNKTCRIKIVSRCEPSLEGKKFLDQAETILAEHGILFDLIVRD